MTGRALGISKRVLVLVALVLAVLASLLVPDAASAYTKPTHSVLADEIVKALKADGKIEQAAVVGKYKEDLIRGLVGADEWIVATNGWFDIKGAQYNTLQHFHDPWSHQGNGNLADLFSWDIPAGRTADEYYSMADSAFFEGVDELYPESKWNADAFFNLGVALHVLQDVTVPMHTDDDVQQFWKYSHGFYENKVDENLSEYLRPVKPIYTASVKQYHPNGIFPDPYHPDGVYEDNTPYVFVDYAAHQSRELYEQYKPIFALPSEVKRGPRKGQPIFENDVIKEAAVAACAEEMVPLSVQLSAGLISRFLSSNGVGSGNVVMFETSKGQYFGEFSQLTSALDDAGYTVVTSEGSLGNIGDADVLVVPGAAYHSYMADYTSEEAAIIASYVEDGGSLMLLSDHSSYTVGTGLLANSVGVALQPVAINSGPFTLFEPHPVTAGLASVQYFLYSLVADGGTPLIRADGGDAVAVAVDHGGGRAVIFTDYDWATDGYIDSVDNMRLATNTIDWLAGR